MFYANTDAECAGVLLLSLHYTHPSQYTEYCFVINHYYNFLQMLLLMIGILVIMIKYDSNKPMRSSKSSQFTEHESTSPESPAGLALQACFLYLGGGKVGHLRMWPCGKPIQKERINTSSSITHSPELGGRHSRSALITN